MVLALVLVLVLALVRVRVEIADVQARCARCERRKTGGQGGRCGCYYGAVD